MFIVRIIVDEDTTDYKAFLHKQDARARFDKGRLQTYDNEFQSIAIFEIPSTDNPKEAVDAIKAADPAKIRLLDYQECSDKEIEKLAKQLSGLDI